MRIADIDFDEIAPEVLLDRSSPPYVYGQDYYQKFRERADTPIGRQLHEHRLMWVRTYVPTGPVLDFGCGYGVNAVSAPDWRGWDVNPYCQARLREAGRLAEPPHTGFAAVCLFDVLEHMNDPRRWLTQIQHGTTLFVVMPCWSPWAAFEKLPEWRHWRPSEHLLYASPKGLIGFAADCGFGLLGYDTHEQAIGRLDVHAFVFKKPAILP